MSTRLSLLCAGATASARAGRFPNPAEGLDAVSAAAVRGLSAGQWNMMEWWCAPGRAARHTAALLGIEAADAPMLREIDHGDWTGVALATLDPAALARWIADPVAGTPGGESLSAVRTRVGAWMDSLTSEKRHIGAVTHPSVIRAAIAHALAMPLEAAMAIDLAPLSLTSLSFQGRWRLQELRRA